MMIEILDEKDWFDAGLQNSMHGQTECCMQTMKWTSNKDDDEVAKSEASSMVSDMCPYLQN